MSADQSTSELTTRDVLIQADRRVSLIEGDVRELREQVDARFNAARRENAEEFARARADLTGFRAEVAAQFATMRAEATAQWRWTIGLLLVSWVSIMGSNLLR